MPTLLYGKRALPPLTSLLVMLACAGDPLSPVVATPTVVEFGEVDVGGSVARSITVTNTTEAPLPITDVIVSGAGVSVSGPSLPYLLSPGKTIHLAVELAPTTSGDVTGSVSLLSAGAKQELAEIRTNGKGVTPNTALVPEPATVSFGEVTVGQRLARQATLRNTGTSTLHVSSLSVSAPGTTVAGLALPATFASGESVTVTATFAPSAPGAVAGSVAFKSEQGRPLAVVELDGTGVSPAPPVTLTATPARLDFGGVTIGSFGAQGVTLTNGSSQSVTIAGIATAGTGFSASAFALPAVLIPGGSVTLGVKFAPTATGTASGQVTVRGAGGETLAAVELAGSGVAAAAITSVTVRDATVVSGSSVQMIADVVAVGTIDRSVTWSVGTLGTVDATTGVYTAPAIAGVYRVWATSNANPDMKGSGLVTVTADPGSGTITPVSGVVLGASNGGDDTSALNAAIDQANGGTVIVPGSGAYVVRAVAVDRPGTTIVCTGTPAATIKLKKLASGDGSPIFNVTANGFTLEKCILDGQKALQPGNQEGFNDSYLGRRYRAGIRMEGAYSGLTIRSATFRYMYGAAIETRDASAISVTDSVFLHNNFEAVFASSSLAIGAGWRDGYVFTGNVVTDTRSHGTSVNANAMLVKQMNGVRIENNVFDGFERNAMKLENCKNGRVATNRISNMDLPNWAGIGMQNGAHYMTITGNTISNTGSGIDTSLVVGGQFPSDKIENVTISGNTISSIKSGTMADGIRILGYSSATTNVFITGNTIRNVPRYGINLRQFTTYYPTPTFSYITIQNNALTSAGTCSNWFAGTAVAPANVTSSPNSCY